MNKPFWAAFAVSILLVGCSKPEPTSATSSTTDQAIIAESTKVQLALHFSEAANAFQQAAQKQTKTMLNACAAMQSDIQTFIESRSDEAQLKAQESYLPCYQAWVQSAVFFQQPFNLSEQKGFSDLVDLIDTRPFLPGYIDGIPEYPFSGLVHELDLPINVNTLKSQHRLMDEDSASVGFPVIEFFLWKTPTADNWVATTETQSAVERRLSYLSISTTLLLDHLTQSMLRWQRNNGFGELPERAKMTLVLKSIHQLVNKDILDFQFTESVFEEPEWHHTALISGSGRTYPLLKLSELQLLLKEDAELAKWLSQFPEAPVTISQLHEAVTASIEAIKTLPENYPLAASKDENWDMAHQELVKTVDLCAQLMAHFNVSIAAK